MKILGHRGGRNLWAENSLSGFRNAIALGIEAIELDVHLTRDGEVVVIHDPFLERTTTGNGPVQQHSLEALGNVFLKDTLHETIATLDQILDLFQTTSIELDIEIKTDSLGNPYKGLVEKVATKVRTREMEKRSCLTCFVPEVIDEIREIAPEMRRLASVDRRSTEMLGGLEKTLKRFIGLGCTLAIEKSLLECCFDHCLSMVGANHLGVWVPNTPQDIAYWLDMPICQLTTDRPDIALALRAQKQAATK